MLSVPAGVECVASDALTEETVEGFCIRTSERLLRWRSLTECGNQAAALQQLSGVPIASNETAFSGMCQSAECIKMVSAASVSLFAEPCSPARLQRSQQGECGSL